MRRISLISATVTAVVLAAGCSSGSSVERPDPNPPAATTSTTAKPFAGGINGPVSPASSGPLGH